MTYEQEKDAKYLPLKSFYAMMEKRISRIDSDDGFALVSLDIDNFNYINDLFSYATGDKILEIITEHFSKELDEGEGFANIHGDQFLFYINAVETAIVKQRFLNLVNFSNLFHDVLPKDYSLIVSGGMIAVLDAKVSVTSLVDKANIARKRAKGNDTTTFRIYDDKIDDEIKWQKIITYMMESAITNHEIEMYLQPKVLIKNGHIVGAEALSRWKSPKYGMIYPDRFIPIMERTGFIRQLDFFILDEACGFLARCQQEGKAVVPISVNFSKANLNTENLTERIFNTVNSRGISTHLIEIEFTESLSSEGLERLIQIISDLKMFGFKVSLDDFGNAYSSLTCLKDLPIDIIKIDKGFLDTSTNSEKGRIILTKMVELIKSLRMLSVVEGIEEEEQLEFLKKLGCDMGQGYYYAKPMPLDAYEEYIGGDSILGDLEEHIASQLDVKDKSYLNIIPYEFQMDNWELYTLGKNIDMGLMKGYLDGEATVQYVNDKALEYLGYTRREFYEIFNNSIVAFTHPDDGAIVQKNAEQLISSGKSLKFQTRAIRKDGSIIILKGRSLCVVDSKGRPVGIYAFQDVTEEIAQTEALQSSLNRKISELQHLTEFLRKSEERYRVILDQSEDILFEWDFPTDTVNFTNKYDALFGNSPLTDNVTKNKAIRKIIHPEDHEIFERWIVNTYLKHGKSEAIYRIKAKDGSYISMRCCTTAICDDNGLPNKALGVFSRNTGF